MSRCPFCKRDPYHYEDVGVGSVPVAINCCEPMCALWDGLKWAKQALNFMRNPSPRKQARASRILEANSFFRWTDRP